MKILEVKNFLKFALIYLDFNSHLLPKDFSIDFIFMNALNFIGHVCEKEYSEIAIELV
jgi:hypothetical protein